MLQVTHNPRKWVGQHGDSLPSGEGLVSTLYLTSANESSVNANFSFASSRVLQCLSRNGALWIAACKYPSCPVLNYSSSFQLL